jgi:hypothetical protein
MSVITVVGLRAPATKFVFVIDGSGSGEWGVGGLILEAHLERMEDHDCFILSSAIDLRELRVGSNTTRLGAGLSNPRSLSPIDDNEGEEEEEDGGEEVDEEALSGTNRNPVARPRPPAPRLNTDRNMRRRRRAVVNNKDCRNRINDWHQYK